MIITLKYPIKVEGKKVTELELGRPKVKHLKATDGVKGDIEKVAALISEMACIPPSSVDQIDAEDFSVIAGEFGSFFSPTGVM